MRADRGRSVVVSGSGEGVNVARRKKRKPKVAKDDKEQSQRFVETTRELESDESGEAFDDAMDSRAKPSDLRSRPSGSKSSA